MEAIRSSETSVKSTTSTRRHTPEDGILHSHRGENLKSYISELMFRTDKHKARRLQIDLMWNPNIKRGLSGKKCVYTAYIHDL
jgi:hypothetical protein